VSGGREAEGTLRIRRTTELWVLSPSCHELVCIATLEPLIAHAPTLIAPWLGELERSPWTHITYQSVNSCQQLSGLSGPVRACQGLSGPVRACQGLSGPVYCVCPWPLVSQGLSSCSFAGVGACVCGGP
jgi:hypothetical protein